MSVQIQWIGHASFRLADARDVVYIDPWKLTPAQPDATVVFVSHSHFDHCSPDDVSKIASAQTQVVAPPDTAGRFPSGRGISPGGHVTIGDVTIDAVAAYNIGKDFHPKGNRWLGAVITLSGVRVYYAGDTDQVPEMGDLTEIDVALLPVGGTYTMDPREAAAACRAIAPRIAVPYHWGDIVGGRQDADTFAQAATACQVTILQPGQTLTVS